MPEPKFTIEPLNASKHDRDSFICEEPALTEYLKKRARKEAASRASTCFVIVRDNSPSTILGYYTLSNAGIETKSLPSPILKKLPKYKTTPVTLMGRLARDLSVKGLKTNGATIGQILLMHALEKVYSTSSIIGSTALILDPKNSKVADWYSNFGFQQLSNGQMFLSMKQIGDSIDSQSQ